MISRQCKCGAVWYSSDANGTWICKECGGEIGPEVEEDGKTDTVFNGNGQGHSGRTENADEAGC